MGRGKLNSIDDNRTTGMVTMPMVYRQKTILLLKENILFISIEKQKEKRRPPKLNWIYQNPVLGDYDESDPDPWKYKIIGERIPRSPKWKIIIKLRHTYRQNGKVKGKSSRIMTISYWDFIDQWIDAQPEGHVNDDFYIPEEKFDSALIKLSEAIGTEGNPEVLEQQLEEKLRPWQLKAMEQYKNSEEYGHVHEHVKTWRKCVQLRIESHQKRQKEQEEKEKFQRDAEEEFAREHTRQKNERMGQGDGSFEFSEDEDQMFRRVWKHSYRALSIQFHPDKGGDGKQMKILNCVKDKLGSMVK